MSDDRPIGIFDSGLGGLTVAKEILRQMPNESIAYLGDTARCPYGSRSNETIIQFGLEDAEFLTSQNIKMLIVACNTVSSVALDLIQKKVTDIPVIGVIKPACKAAVTRTAEKKIGVIGTAATVRVNSYGDIIHNLEPDAEVYTQACPLFVPLIEEGMSDNDIAQGIVRHYLDDIISEGIDCLILGCTHYPLLYETIQGVVGARMEIIDSAMWTAKEAESILNALNIRASEDRFGIKDSIFFSTDHTPNFEKNAAKFLGKKIDKNIKYIKLEQLTAHSA